MSKKARSNYKIMPVTPREGEQVLNVEITRVLHPPKEVRRYIYWSGGRN